MAEINYIYAPEFFHVEMFTSIVILKWFILFFSFMSIVSFRWGIREIKKSGNKTILRTCLTLSVVFAVLAVILIMNYQTERYAGY